MPKIARLLLLFVLVSGASFPTYGQKSVNSLLNTAKKKRLNLDYPESIRLYKKVLAVEKDNPKALDGLIDIYLYRYEIFDSAKVYIDKRMEHLEEDPDEAIYFHAANCLRMQEKPFEAIEYYQYFKDNALSKSSYAYLEDEVNDHLESCRYAIKNKREQAENSPYAVENMGYFINSVDPEYTPVFIEEDSLLLYNARYKDFDTEEIAIVDNKYYENIYYFDLEESVASSYNPSIEQENHHAVIGGASDGDSVLVFYQNKIWVSGIERDRLNDINPLPKQLSDFYFQPHGVFADKGNTIIFSAMKKPREKGGDLDIYISHKKDNIWSKPKLISPVINSEKDEDSPYLSADGKTLYFSSKGHGSSGGYDMYKSELVNGEWSYPENLGYPMNSAGDDIYLTFTKSGEKGYFASNRNGGFGGMDIYTFNVGGKGMNGVIVDQNGNPIKDAKITLTNLDYLTETELVTGESGKYNFELDRTKNYEILVEKDGYATYREIVNTTKPLNNLNITMEKDANISILSLVTNKATGKPIENVNITITDNMTGVTETYVSSESGELLTKLNDKTVMERGSYNISMSKDGFVPKTVTYNTIFDTSGVFEVHKTMDLSLEAINISSDLAESYEINPIYFDLDKSNIRPDAAKELDKVVAILNENPDMMIELGAHTDARGSSSYNMSLSKRRAKNSADYIKSRISNPQRVEYKGYGETRLANNCDNNTECSETNHEKNRRTEFIITKL